MKPSGYCGLLRQARVLINNLMVGSGNLGTKAGVGGGPSWGICVARGARASPA